MWKFNFLNKFYIRSSANTKSRRCPFTYSVNGQYRGFVVWRTVKAAGRMGEVMLAEEYFGLINAQLFLKQVLYPELITKCGRRRMRYRSKAVTILFLTTLANVAISAMTADEDEDDTQAFVTARKARPLPRRSPWKRRGPARSGVTRWPWPWSTASGT